MHLVILANEILKQELLAQGHKDDVILSWVNTIDELVKQADADGYLDLLFNSDDERIHLLKQLGNKLVIINDVTGAKKLPANFMRINGWITFLKRAIIEASTDDEMNKQQAETLFDCFNKKIEWLPSTPGFITARVVAMIINEAYLALEEGVSTKEEIDIAMKLGTSYPFGPFEWCEMIGIKNIVGLLNILSLPDNRYAASTLLKKESQTL